MSENRIENDYIKKLNTKLYELDLDFEEKKKIKKRELIHSYIEDFKNFDSELLSNSTESSNG